MSNVIPSLTLIDLIIEKFASSELMPENSKFHVFNDFDSFFNTKVKELMISTPTGNTIILAITKEEVDFDDIEEMIKDVKKELLIIKDNEQERLSNINEIENLIDFIIEA